MLINNVIPAIKKVFVSSNMWSTKLQLNFASMCEHFTSVVSADAAHTELARILTTVPPAKRQPVSSTGNVFKIMSLLHYKTRQWQPILSFKQPWIFSCMAVFCGLENVQFPFFLSSSQFYHLCILLTIFIFVPFFISFSSWYSVVSALFSHFENSTTHTIYPYYYKTSKTMRDNPASVLKLIHAVF